MVLDKKWIYEQCRHLRNGQKTCKPNLNRNFKYFQLVIWLKGQKVLTKMWNCRSIILKLNSQLKDIYALSAIPKRLSELHSPRKAGVENVTEIEGTFEWSKKTADRWCRRSCGICCQFWKRLYPLSRRGYCCIRKWKSLVKSINRSFLFFPFEAILPWIPKKRHMPRNFLDRIMLSRCIMEPFRY